MSDTPFPRAFELVNFGFSCEDTLMRGGAKIDAIELWKLMDSGITDLEALARHFRVKTSTIVRRQSEIRTAGLRLPGDALHSHGTLSFRRRNYRINPARFWDDVRANPRSVSELAGDFGVTHGAISYQLATLRALGYDVPVLPRKRIAPRTGITREMLQDWDREGLSFAQVLERETVVRSTLQYAERCHGVRLRRDTGQSRLGIAQRRAELRAETIGLIRKHRGRLEKAAAALGLAPVGLQTRLRRWKIAEHEWRDEAADRPP